MKAQLNFGELGGGGKEYFDETYVSLPQTIDIGFKWAEIYLIGEYAGNNAQLFYSKQVFSNTYYLIYNNGSSAVRPNVGDTNSGGILSVTDTTVTFTSGGYSYWSNVQVVAIPYDE